MKRAMTTIAQWFNNSLISAILAGWLQFLVLPDARASEPNAVEKVAANIYQKRPNDSLFKRSQMQTHAITVICSIMIG